MAEKTIFKQKKDDFKTKKQAKGLIINILTSSKNEIKKTKFKQKTSRHLNFGETFMFVGLP